MREYVSDTHASGTGKGVTIAHFEFSVRIVPDGAIWWVYFDHKSGVFRMPPLAVTRHDFWTVRNVAETIIGYFDPALSTPAKRSLNEVACAKSAESE